MTVTVTHTAAELRARYRNGAERAVVMTLGALHEGHAANIRAARERVGPAGQIVVTVYVNPLQFGAGEDFERYPRTLEADVKVAEEAGADLLFAPSDAEMYPDGRPLVTLCAGPLGERLEGAHRPGHFDGMLTVVAKLLHLTRADVATFGEKDAQQLALVRRMVADLDFPVEIVPVPTVREPDGLARSSRNRYLSPAERGTALALSAALAAAAERPDAAGARAAAGAVLEAAAGQDPPLELDYLALLDPADLLEVADDFAGEALLAVAARVGTTRLIDNRRLTLRGPA
ncbi:pantoate--beta-alanine ligase [Streptomyces sp. 3MP-14]|uniref:Pantothenate synthetase n=1 Tax=Streptomyces mimosae TaxID=2586635 RepID=A0A5N6A804_9ACTN|nr:MULTISPECIES: pantoate--beta-alanine ligase [Streptomyces]KAB8163860.1 pantoate--beta-alanine ligase [Streptomyces mimosae]KAB8175303.1 pantoate--beta-alanine ligase [Streptomyces sp. 3MP-14]